MANRKPTENESPACNGTGFPKVKQPVQLHPQNQSGALQGTRWQSTDIAAAELEQRRDVDDFLQIVSCFDQRI
jgi:hypothetical protein